MEHETSLPAAGASCPACGGALPPESRFCPHCGARIGTETGDTAVIPPPPNETGPVPVSTVTAEPHLFGVTPPLALAALGVGSLAAGIVLVALDRLAVGLVLIGIAAVLLAAFAAELRRKRRSRVLGGVRARVGAAAQSVAARSTARRELARRRQELDALAAKRAGLLRQLGEAVYGGDRKATQPLRLELKQLDEDAAAKEAEMATIAAQAQEQVERARLEVQPTEMVEVPEPYPPPDEGDPPEPARLPEPYPPPGEGDPPEPARIPEPYPDPGEADIPEPPSRPTS